MVMSFSLQALGTKAIAMNTDPYFGVESALFIKTLAHLYLATPLLWSFACHLLGIFCACF